MAGGMRSARSHGRLALVVGAVVLALVSACSGGDTKTQNVAKTSKDSDSGSGKSEKSAKPTKPPAPAATVAVQPAKGATGISPTTPITVKAAKGTLESVSVTNPAGRQVKGALSADKTAWTSAEELGYSKTYTVSAVATNAEGTKTTSTSSFSTVKPANFTLPYLSPGSGTVGVGAPIRVHFDEPIPDKAAAERTLVVTTTPAVQGSWYWSTSQDAAWRPPKYWTPGTKVTVTAKVYGVHMGGGLYGQADKSTSFTIGRSKIAIVDDRTHKMQVFFDGKKARADIPVSMGRGGCINVKGRQICFTTQSGPHIVAEKYKVKHMTSASYGLPEDNPLGYSEDLPWASRISQDGEFVHENAATVGVQGVRNVSHGCINVNPANAKWFYDNFGPGDIVDVRNTGVPLKKTDGSGDWMIPWSEWQAGSALR